jgi:hypothetical protein
MLIDCTYFFNDFDMLENRLKYLWNTVDLFLLYEADKTFSGFEKKFNFLTQYARFQPYISKLLYIPIHINTENFIWNIPNAPQPRYTSITKEGVENYQRNFLHCILPLFHPDDDIIITDLDEIPSISGIHEARALLSTSPLVSLLQILFYYNFKKRQELLWAGPFITKVSHAKLNNIYDLRMDASIAITPKVWNGGWHLSHWGSADKIREKIIGSQHQEYNKDEFINNNHINECIEKNIDLYNRNLPFIPFDIQTLPKDFYEVFNMDAHLELKHFHDSIHGYFYPEDFKVYKDIIAKLKDGAVVVEVGSFKGKSSSYMAVEIVNSHKNIKFYCVDTWEGSEEHQKDGVFEDKDVVEHSLYDVFVANMKPVEGYYIPMQMTSVEASKLFADNSIDFVYIDAAHDYDSVKEDIEHWILKVKTGGTIGGHDYFHDPVRRAIKRTIGRVEERGSSWTYIKS